MSASTSCLPEMNQPRPKSSFDLVRHAREKEAAQPPQREIFSDAPELTTDDENRLPGLHKNTTIKIDKKHKNQVGKMRSKSERALMRHLSSIYIASSRDHPFLSVHFGNISITNNSPSHLS